MGQNISAEDAKVVQQYMKRQEDMINHLQSIVEQQNRSLQAINRTELDPKAVRDYDGNESGDEEFRRISADTHKSTQRREREPPVSDTERAQKDLEYKETEKHFMATKPWLGAMAPPTGYVKKPEWDELPKASLHLEYVYGYRARNVRNNAFWIDSDRIVYFAAAVGIVHNLANNTQHFFTGHTDDILCMDYHPTKKLVATGQQGKHPTICVWDVETGNALATLQGFHQRAVWSVAFSADGSKVASVGEDDNHSIAVYEWQQGGAPIATSNGDTNKILDIQWNKTRAADPNNDFVTVGEKHISFWTIGGGRIQSQAGILGNVGERQTFLSAAFTPDYTVVGCKSGQLYTFKGNTIKDVIQAHNGMVYSVFADLDSERLYSGGKDGICQVWSTKDFKKLKSFNLSKLDSVNGKNSVRAIHQLKGQNHVLIGTLASTLYKANYQTGDITPVVAAHFGNIPSEDSEQYAELWGLSTHPSKKQFASVCEDSTLRIWDIEARKVVTRVELGRAALTCSYSPDGKKIAVGCTDGSVSIIDTQTNLEDVRKKAAKRRVACLKYSPDGNFLAAGTADNLLVVFDVQKEYKVVGTGKGASSVVLHLDWSPDSKHIQINSQAYELLHFDAATSGVTFHAHSLELKDVHWATQECVLGWNVQGIWPKDSDGSDVNNVNRSHNSKYLATAEDSGAVKLFNFPCVGGHLNTEGALTKRPQSYRALAHSSHVTNVNWSYDDSYVISTGGADLSICQWKVING